MVSTYTDIKEVLNGILKEHSIHLEYSELKDIFEEHTSIDDDFRLELDGYEFRVIADLAIWGIYRDAIEETVKDCYLGGVDIPGFVEIDWEQTAENCKVDGYGHQFSVYDGSELCTKNYWVFREG